MMILDILFTAFAAILALVVAICFWDLGIGLYSFFDQAFSEDMYDE